MKKALLAYAILILVVGALVTAVMPETEATEEEEPKEARAALANAPEIARRVERLREKRFPRGAPKVELLPKAELDRALAAAGGPPDQDERLGAAAALLLAQVGALPAEDAAALVERRHLGPGAYLPEERVVLIEEELAKEQPKAAELLAARELARALDAEMTPEAPHLAPLFRDDEAARLAVNGGAAALVERAYAEEHMGGDQPPTEIAPGAPPAIRTLAAFPLQAGGGYVARLVEQGGVAAVDKALAEPPESTRAVLHMDEARAPAERSPDFVVEPVLGEGWTRLSGANVGELDTIALLRTGLRESPAVQAAAGWRAGRFETWTRREGCPPPCRRESASVVVIRFANPATALRFVRSMRRALMEGAGAKPDGGRGFAIEDGGAALVRAGRFAGLTFAVDSRQAGELADAALEG